MAPAAQLNGAVAIGMGGGGSMTVGGGGNFGSSGEMGAALPLPPPQPDMAAKKNKPDSHLRRSPWRVCVRINGVFTEIFGVQCAAFADAHWRMSWPLRSDALTGGQHGTG